MSWNIYVDTPGLGKQTVSDVEYAEINFGNGVEDNITFEDSDGHRHIIYLRNVSAIMCRGPVSPPPGTYPGWRMVARGAGGVSEYIVGNTIKETIESELLVEDARVEFLTLEGYTVHLYTKNLDQVHFAEDSLLIPEP